MSTKRKLSDGSRESAKHEIKKKKPRVEKQDPPVAFFVADMFAVGTAELGVDPFDLGSTHYNDPLPRASPELRKSTVIETNRTIVWLLPNRECNCAEKKDVWSLGPLASRPLEHYSRGALVTKMVEEYLPLPGTSSSPLADLVYSYMRSRGVSYEELWACVRAVFHSRLGPHKRSLLQLGSEARVSDTFPFGMVVAFETEESYDGDSVVVIPIFKHFHPE